MLQRSETGRVVHGAVLPRGARKIRGSCSAEQGLARFSSRLISLQLEYPGPD